MNGSLREPTAPPGWISKPLFAMTPDELYDLRSALCRETPPDVALLRAIDRQLTLFMMPPPSDDHRTVPGAAPGDAPGDGEPGTGPAESDDWALDG